MLKRPVAVILLVTLMPQLTGCIVHTTQGVPLANLRLEERTWLDAGDSSAVRRATRDLRIAGVTTSEGRPVMFDTLPAPWEERNSVFANVGGRPTAISSTAIEEVWLVRAGHQPVSVRTSSFARALEATLRREPITGVTARNGERVAFDRSAPVNFARDTLHAAVHGRPYALALNDVERAWMVRTDPGLSLLASAGVIAGVIVVWAGVALAASQIDLGFSLGGR